MLTGLTPQTPSWDRSAGLSKSREKLGQKFIKDAQVLISTYRAMIESSVELADATPDNSPDFREFVILGTKKAVIVRMRRELARLGLDWAFGIPESALVTTPDLVAQFKEVTAVIESHITAPARESEVRHG